MCIYIARYKSSAVDCFNRDRPAASSHAEEEVGANRKLVVSAVGTGFYSFCVELRIPLISPGYIHSYYEGGQRRVRNYKHAQNADIGSALETIWSRTGLVWIGSGERLRTRRS